MAKQNCWEFKNCGRQPGGIKTGEFGVCPAASEKKMDGVHEGKNAGRVCWVIAGTLCGGQVQGTFAQKDGSCSRCDFFKTVIRDEGFGFKNTQKLAELLS